MYILPIIIITPPFSKIQIFIKDTKIPLKSCIQNPLLKHQTRCFREHLYLDSQDAKDDEKGTADENYVSYRLQRGDQSLHNQFEARSSTDNPVRREKSI